MPKIHFLVSGPLQVELLLGILVNKMWATYHVGELCYCQLGHTKIHPLLVALAYYYYSLMSFDEWWRADQEVIVSIDFKMLACQSFGRTWYYIPVKNVPPSFTS